MQKINFNINGKHYEATITEVEHNVAEVELNGKKYTIDVERSEAVSSAPRVVAPKAAAPAAAPVATGSKPGFTLNNRNIGIIAVAAVAVLALLISCFFIFGGRSYKDVVKDYFKATEKADAKLMMELLPGDLIKYVMKEEDMTKKEMTEDLQDSLDMIHNYYDDVKISYEITDTEDFDKDDLKDIKENYKEIEDSDYAPHNFVNGACKVCKISANDVVESEHNYDNFLDKTWTITRKCDYSCIPANFSLSLHRYSTNPTNLTYLTNNKKLPQHEKSFNLNLNILADVFL